MTEDETEPVGEAVVAEPNPRHEQHAEHPPSPGQPPQEQRTGTQRVKVMLLGSGELSRELAIALQRLGAEVIAVERYADAPAHQVADHALVVRMTDADELSAAIRRVQPDYVVTLTDGVAADALTAAAESGLAELVPSARGARLTTDLEGLRRLASDELGLPTAPYWFAGSLDELQAVAAHAGSPLVVKPLGAATGQGQSLVSGPDEVEAAWRRAVSAGSQRTHNRVLAEVAVEVDVHVTLLAVRSEGSAGPVIEFCTPIGHGEASGDVLESWQPQQLSPAALDAGKSIAARIVKSLGGRGVFGVELMVRGDEVYFCDVTARPYETGLVTLRTQRLSLFELQARAILGLTVDTIMISPGAAQLIYSGHDARNVSGQGETLPPGALAAALAVPESDIRVFGYHEADTRRRLGVALATAPEISAARDRARQAATALRSAAAPVSSRPLS